MTFSLLSIWSIIVFIVAYVIIDISSDLNRVFLTLFFILLMSPIFFLIKMPFIGVLIILLMGGGQSILFLFALLFLQFKEKVDSSFFSQQKGYIFAFFLFSFLVYSFFCYNLLIFFPWNFQEVPLLFSIADSIPYVNLDLLNFSNNVKILGDVFFSQYFVHFLIFMVLLILVLVGLMSLFKYKN